MSTILKQANALAEVVRSDLPRYDKAAFLFRAVCHVVGADGGHFMWLNEDADPVDGWAAQNLSPNVETDFLQRFMNNTQAEAILTFRQMAMRGEDFAVPHKGYQETAFGRWARNVGLPSGSHIMVRVGGRPVGVLCPARTDARYTFSKRDLYRAQPLLGSVRAMLHQPVTEMQAACADPAVSCVLHRGSLILRQGGGVLHYVGKAVEILSLALNLPWGCQISPREAFSRAEPLLTRLADDACRNTSAQWRCRHAGGLVNLFAQTMDSTEPAASPGILVSLEVQVSRLALALVHPLFSELPVQQQRLVRLLLMGETGQGLAVSMGIAPSSVKTHTRLLFSRLGVSRREEIWGVLSRPPDFDGERLV